MVSLQPKSNGCEMHFNSFLGLGQLKRSSMCSLPIHGFTCHLLPSNSSIASSTRLNYVTCAKRMFSTNTFPEIDLSGTSTSEFVLVRDEKQEPKAETKQKPRSRTKKKKEVPSGSLSSADVILSKGSKKVKRPNGLLPENAEVSYFPCLIKTDS